ncbi:MAG: hypothetical protein JWM86_2208 [Thermoleophilia bacterium]|nr:hypothetical protein [Thermoleophilia bacterium]
MPKFSPALSNLATRQHGWVNIPQLLGHGFTRSSIGRAARSGLLRAGGRGVYALGHVEPTRESRWSRAVLQAGSGAALAGFASCQSWGVTRRRTTRIDIVVPARRRPLSGNVHLQLTRSFAADVVEHGGIQTLPLPITLVLLTPVVGRNELANMLHEAEHRKLLDLTAFDELFARPGRIPGRRDLWDALAYNLSGNAGSMSMLEDDAAAEFTRAGFEPTLVNGAVRDEDGHLRPDLWWPELRIIVEIDGPPHDRRRAKRDDAERQRRLERAGYTVIRIHYLTFYADPQSAISEAVRALRSRTLIAS